MSATTRLLVVIGLIAGAVVAPSGLAQAVTSPETLYHERGVGSAPVEPGFPIDYVGVVFELPAESDAHHDHGEDDDHGVESLAVRFRHSGVWGPWQQVPEDGAQAVGTWTGALVDGDDAEAYQVRGLPEGVRNARAGALNTTDGEAVVVGHRPVGTADAVTPCKSRLDWAADESIRKGTRNFAPMQVATVHHTATKNNDDNPDARVRAIYEYHVLTNGWDDIGYQALISEDGTVYEGRWSGSDSLSCANGGTTAAFGHQTTEANSDIVTGAHTGGYNTGNFGVALLGTFTRVAPKAPARTALVEYLAELFERHGLNPETRVTYSNGTNSKQVWTIAGHQDFTSTKCPGGVLYDDLLAIRSDVTTAMTAETDTAPVVTITSPANADTYTVTETTEGQGIQLTFAAAANEDIATWSWTDGSGSPWTDDSGVEADTSSFSKTLPVSPYPYTFNVSGTDPGGSTGTDTIAVEVEAADSSATTHHDVASSETTTAGTVTGSYADTHAGGGSTETITEVSTNGKPSSRVSLLEHTWTVNVTGSSDVMLYVDASATNSGEGDDFVFEYSVDGGASYSTAFIIVAGASGGYYQALAATSGEVRIRVRDLDRIAGRTALDSIVVDHLFISSSN